MMERKMFYHAGPLVFERAKEWRNNRTHPERMMWSCLRAGPFGYGVLNKPDMGINEINTYLQNALTKNQKEALSIPLQEVRGRSW